MVLIHDSDAFLNSDRLLSQHQAAISLLQGKLDRPGLTDFKWLDLSCGKGQIIANLEQNIGDVERSKIVYSGYDIIEEHLSITLKKAETLNFKSADGKVGDISDFPNLFPIDDKYDFITLTNSIHEFSPLLIPNILIECTIRLSSTGILFIYDMETLPSLELGAITWTREEIHELLKSFIKNLEILNYTPTPGRWTHSANYGWSIQIIREYINVNNEELIQRKDKAIELIMNDVISILQRKLDECEMTLESITKHGAETEEEEKLKQKLLYDFWSLNRIKEIKQ